MLTRRTDTRINKGGPIPKKRTIYFPPSPNQQELGSTKTLRTTLGGTQPTTPARDRAQCVVQHIGSKVNPVTLQLGRRTMFILRLGQTIHDQDVTMVSRIEEGKLPDARRRTMNSTEFPKLKLTMNLGKYCGPNKGSLSLCQRMCDPGPEYRFKFTPVGTFPPATPG